MLSLHKYQIILFNNDTCFDLIRIGRLTPEIFSGKKVNILYFFIECLLAIEKKYNVNNYQSKDDVKKSTSEGYFLFPLINIMQIIFKQGKRIIVEF